MKEEGPLCSVVIPCRNEAGSITRCLDSICANKNSARVEVIVADGMSDDGTVDVIRSYLAANPGIAIRLIRNGKRITPSGMNLGIEAARGKYIAIIGAHNFISETYLPTALSLLEEGKADCVGGRAVCLPSDGKPVSRAIACVMNSRFGVGLSFRTGGNMRYADTAPSPVYKREVFERIGLFDEEMIRNQDDEFNFRLAKAGGRILLVPDIKTYYHARNSYLKLWRMFYQYGYFKPLVARKHGRITVRQLMPLLFIGLVLLSATLSSMDKTSHWASLLPLFSYLFFNFFFSLHIALRKGIGLFPFLPAAFIAVHFGYGSGYLKGVLDFLVLKRRSRKKDIPLTR